MEIVEQNAKVMTRALLLALIVSRKGSIGNSIGICA
jgi:hypothetical protein